MRYVSLAAVLFCFWIVLSGFLTPGLMTFGVLTCLAAILLARRMGAVDEEGHPIELMLGAITYWPWLIKEIIKSSWSVSKIIIDPKLPISPTIVTLTANQRTAAALATYANSITLTPGTVTVGVAGREFTVHALVQESAEDLRGGEMDRRVCKLEGSS